LCICSARMNEWMNVWMNCCCECDHVRIECFFQYKMHGRHIVVWWSLQQSVLPLCVKCSYHIAQTNAGAKRGPT
jgi:hypothetical protein